MAKMTLHGEYDEGSGDASNWGTDDIRGATGWSRLVDGTFNVRIEGPHTLRPDFHLARGDRNPAYAHTHEHLDFERCILLLPGGARVPALIARTSNNFWGPSVLEVMAEEHLRSHYALAKGDCIDVEVWIGDHAAAEAEAAMASHRLTSDDRY